MDSSRELSQAVSGVVLGHMQHHWWAAYRLAIELRSDRPAVSRALRSLKRRGLVETSGQLWRRIAVADTSEHPPQSRDDPSPDTPSSSYVDLEGVGLGPLTQPCGAASMTHAGPDKPLSDGGRGQ